MGCLYALGRGVCTSTLPPFISYNEQRPFPSTPGDPITPLTPLHHAVDNLVMNNNADYHGPPLPPTTCTHSPLTAALSSTTPPPPDSLPSTHCSPCSD